MAEVFFKRNREAEWLRAMQHEDIGHTVVIMCTGYTYMYHEPRLTLPLRLFIMSGTWPLIHTECVFLDTLHLNTRILSFWSQEAWYGARKLELRRCRTRMHEHDTTPWCLKAVLRLLGSTELHRYPGLSPFSSFVFIDHVWLAQKQKLTRIHTGSSLATFTDKTGPKEQTIQARPFIPQTRPKISAGWDRQKSIFGKRAVNRVMLIQLLCLHVGIIYRREGWTYA